MFLLRFTKIIGSIAIFILLITQATPTYAIYSPVIGETVEEVKGHIFQARQNNGIGTFYNMYENLSDDRGDDVGMLGLYWDSVKEAAVHGAMESFWDGFSLFILSFVDKHSTITACLRDDIWELQALQEEVVNELFKSAMLNDFINAPLLWDDYNELDALVDILKNDFNNTEGLFPGSNKNYYLNCPYGEFTEAWDELTTSFDNFLHNAEKAITLGGFEEVAKNAERRAKQRAAKWIAENAIDVSFGGKNGANPKSLTDKPVLGSLADEFEALTDKQKDNSFLEKAWSDTVKNAEEAGKWVVETAEDIAEGAGQVKDAIYHAITGEEIADPFSPSFKPGSHDLSKVISVHKKVQEQREKLINESKLRARFNLQLKDVSEQSLMDIEGTLLEINLEIQKAFAGDNESLIIFCEHINAVNKGQATNKDPTAPTCR